MNDELLDKALAALPVSGLDPDFASHALAVARTELAPAPSDRAMPFQLGLALRGALVPALLSVAAVGRTALTVEAAATIYGESDPGAAKR
jgi:hypothetical protein